MYRILIPVITIGLFTCLASYSYGGYVAKPMTDDHYYDVEALNKLAGEAKPSTLVQRQAKALDDVYGITKAIK